MLIRDVVQADKLIYCLKFLNCVIRTYYHLQQQTGLDYVNSVRI